MEEMVEEDRPGGADDVAGKSGKKGADVRPQSLNGGPVGNRHSRPLEQN
jgi:hypothetical protein